MNTDENWLASLKPGDTVIYRHYMMMEPRREVKQVTRVTATMVIVETKYPDRAIEHRMSRKSGKEIGGDHWHCPCIEQATPEIIETVKAENRRRNLVYILSKKTEWDKVPTEILESVYVLLNPPKTPDAESNKG
jgi:hypothetical protein